MHSVYKDVLELENEIVGHRRILHQLAEVGVDLHETSTYVTKVLRQYGVDFEVICQSGIVATIGPKSSKTLLLRADMDALPMTEMNDLIYKSNTPHVAHTCGHDMHTAMLLVAAKILKQQESSLKGCVKLMFQPDEEGLTGAKLMIDSGVLENPKVDAALAIHVFPALGKTGTFAYKKGVCAAGASRFKIDIQGVGGHGAIPEYSIDPILIATHIYQGLHTIISHEFSSVEPLVLTIGNFVANGAPNIIPDTALLEGSLRFFDFDSAHKVNDRIKHIATHTATMFGGKAKVSDIGTCPPLKNDDTVLSEILSYIADEFGQDALEEVSTYTTASEDFAFILDEVPGAYLALYAGSKENGYEHMCHHPEVLFDEEVLAYGVSALVVSATRWLEDNAK